MITVPQEATPMFEIRTRDGELIAEAETHRAAELARTTISKESGLPFQGPLSLVIHFPADFRFPVVGGGTATAAELRLPLVEAI